jgi:DNA-binding GntR family transcriptional regulator
MSSSPETLADQAYVRAEEMIVTLELAPGQVISESDLAQHLDIGRTPLREALQRLAEDQLVEILPRKGIRITEITLRDQMALLETRRVLDRLVASRAARRADQGHREALRDCARAMHDAAETDQLDAFMEHDRRFDEIVAAAAQNPFATDALAPLHAHCRRFWYKFRANGDLTQSARLHEQLMRSIAEADYDGAAEASDALVDYLERFTRSLLDPA